MEPYGWILKNSGKKKSHPSLDTYVFMNNETYEQLEIPTEKLTDQIKYLKELYRKIYRVFKL